MIKRVDGGGVGLVNPMGWYDAERADTPSPSPPGQPSESTRVNTDDEAIMDDDDDDDDDEADVNPRSRVTESPTDIRGSPILRTGQAFTDEPEDEPRTRDKPVSRSNIPTIVARHYGSGDEEADITSREKVPYAGRTLTDGTYCSSSSGFRS